MVFFGRAALRYNGFRGGRAGASPALPKGQLWPSSVFMTWWMACSGEAGSTGERQAMN